MNYWKRYRGYFIGASVSYATAFAVHYIGGDSNLQVRIAWALVWGSLTWPFFVAAQFLIQWITEKLSGGRFNTSVSKQFVILNAPIVILAVSIVTYQYIVSTP